MLSGDVIHEIEGEPTEPMSLNEAVSKLKGPKGTEVRITILRRGLGEPLALTVPRAEIPQNTVRYAYMMTPEVGYLRLTDFSRSTAREMTEALAKLRGEGMRKLLLDLRSNGGGLLDQAVAVCDLFLPAGSEIVETRGRLPDTLKEFLDHDDDPDPELAMPLVVLVNAGTASAAEILAGAIQDHDVGLIVGTPTWGKGLVQTVYYLTYGTGIALTTARYHTPSGRVIQRDYSSYYDYYAHFSGDADAAARPGAGERVAAEPEFRTDLGRTVFGGGGITPDVPAELPDLPMTLQALFAHNAFFEFAIDYHRRRPVTSQDWRPGAELLDEFGSWLEEQGYFGPEIAAILGEEAVRDFTLRQIHADIFNAAFGTEAAHRVLATGDAQIQSALGLFGQAGDLLARRSSLGGGAGGREPAPAARATSRPPKTVAVPAPKPEFWPPDLRAAALFARAKLLAEGGAFAEALEALRQSLELDGSDPYARLAAARFRASLASSARDGMKRRGHLEAAVAEVAAARALAPGDPEVLRHFADIQLRWSAAAGDREALELAREAWETVRETAPGDLMALASLGRIYLQQREPARAVEVLRAAQSYQPGNRTIQVMLADALLAADDREGAEQTLEEILARHPEDQESRGRLARLHSEQGDHRRAVAVLREAPAASEARPPLGRLLARELHLIGANAEALEVVDGLLAESPGAGLRRLRAAILSELMRYEEAIAELEPLLAAEGDAERAKRDALMLARLLERVGRSEEAAEIRRKLEAPRE